MEAIQLQSVVPAQGGADIVALIGNTPLHPIRSLCPNPNVQIFAKLERGNPGGSVKDRIALWMIKEGERSGGLTRDKTILEATSGNTGIGLAMIAAARGYRIMLAMSEGVSVERRKILAAYGAEFLLTPAAKGTDGAIERAYELANEEPNRFFLTDQYNNEANLLAHYHGTAEVFWRQTGGRITHFVATMGTTGTLMGCSRRFRELNPKIRVVGVEPYLGHRLQGLKNLKEAYVPGIFDSSALDRKLNIEDEAAWEMTRALARKEGLLVGMSSGAAMHTAYELAKQIESGIIVALFPDGGERYLSTPLFQVKQTEAAARLHFFNSLSRQHEPFELREGAKEVTMYSCGPTVHRRPHLGVLRRMLVDDVVRRSLELAGHRVKHVVSITDVDDFTIRESERTGEPLQELCRRHEAEFHDDLKAIAVKPAQVYCRSSESVDSMIKLTRDLMERGFAYEQYHSVYFNIGRTKSYGDLLGRQGLGAAARGATHEEERYDGLDPRDFVLFRRCDLAEMRKGLSFKTEWGNVRPSWHVECAAMARAHLGDQFDIHTGSVELVFPHHENELAQMRALTGKPQARYWLHSELVFVDEEKMSYDAATYRTLGDMTERGFSSREVRLCLLQTHYRQPLHLTDEKLGAARRALEEIDAAMAALASAPEGKPRIGELEGWITTARDSFRKALYDDLNVAGGLLALSGLLEQVVRLAKEGRLGRTDADAVAAALAEMDG
ncbi:MAG: cysteine synthase, partial [Deltaproteobacteria bacterium]|nr:cysteine synthase [Deltaproteobacteria bacterium]